MSAIGKKKQDKSTQVLTKSPEEILQLRRELENRVGESSNAPGSENELTGIAAEKAIGALCFLPKSIHRLATDKAKDRDITAKRFFLEALLDGLEQQGVITREQHLDCLTLPSEYGWKGRGSKTVKP